MGDPAAPFAEIESPCIGTCTLGPRGLCIGCFRSASEIGDWLSYSAEQRRSIMRDLPERANALFDDE